MTSTRPPWGLRWRSSRTFIISTVAFGLFTDLFLYGIVVPVLPFMLMDRLGTPPERVQSHVSGLLAAYAGASVVSSVPIGWLADKTTSRQFPYLLGLSALFGSTLLLAFGQNMPVLIIARLLQGVSAAAVWTVGMAMVMDTVGPSNLGKIIGSVCLEPHRRHVL
jgi:MFS family permease